LSDGTFVSLNGITQQFGENDVVTERDSTAGTMRDFTIRTTGNQSLVRVTVFPEYAQAIENLQAGDGVYVDGSYSEREVSGKKYKNITARTLAITPVAPRIASGKRAATKTSSF